MTAVNWKHLEAKALDWAKLACAQIMSDDWGNLFAPETSHEMARSLYRYWIENLSVSGAMIVVENATAGDRDADFVLREIITEKRGRGEEMVVPLAHYELQIVQGGPPAARSGRKAIATMMRDRSIIFLIRQLIAKFPLIPATRNRYSPRESACSLISKALNQCNQTNFTKRAVEKVWDRWQLYPELDPNDLQRSVETSWEWLKERRLRLAAPAIKTIT